MNKKLIIINGTMGVGKTTVCKKLNKELQNSVWLDGDWCWMINPFVVNDENKQMSINNITYLLRSFLTNSSLKYVIFDWVIHDEAIFSLILDRLNDLKFELIKITLICSEEALRDRINEDIKKGVRDKDCMDRSIKRLELYRNMDTIKIDTSNVLTNEIEKTVEKIKKIILNNK